MCVCAWCDGECDRYVCVSIIYLCMFTHVCIYVYTEQIPLDTQKISVCKCLGVNVWIGKRKCLKNFKK